MEKYLKCQIFQMIFLCAILMNISPKDEDDSESTSMTTSVSCDSLNSLTSRKDSYGNLIIKGGKSHQINFKEDLEVQIPVENWKEFNSLEELSFQDLCEIK